MPNTMSIDVGGTFTDGYVVFGNRVATARVPSTPRDPGRAFWETVEEAAANLGLSPGELMKQIDIISYGTTVAINTLLQRKGTPLGLITTKGFEDIIYIGRGSSWQDGLSVVDKKQVWAMQKPAPIIPRELVAGVAERIDCFGRVLIPLDEDEVREKVRLLIDRGARELVVCLMWSTANPAHERRVKEIVEKEYPDFLLGSMPVTLSHEVVHKKNEYPRFMTTILDAYVRDSMSQAVGEIYAHARALGHRRPIRMVHNNGGVADMFGTHAVQTVNGGRVAGLMGVAHAAKTYGIGNVILTEMGGTSFDVGLVVQGGTPQYDFMPTIDRWLVAVTILETKAIGAGGGSIAWKNEILQRWEVGPRSAGADPGPVCYDRGGEEPTVTDADLILGYLNPVRFHGGKIRLNTEKARNAIKSKIALPQGIDVEEAALMIRKIVDGNMGNTIFKETAMKGYDPREFVLFSYGGAGPAHCCDYARYVEVPKIIVFRYAPVFCAFGISVMDAAHFYERSEHLALTKPVTMEFVLDTERFNSVVSHLQERALRDMETEGFKFEDIIFQLDLEIKFGQQIHVLRIPSPRVFARDVGDAKAIYDEFVRQYVSKYSTLALNPQSGVDIECFILKTVVPQPKVEWPRFSPRGADPGRAFQGKRSVYWGEFGSFRDTPTYDMTLLECGNALEGPAVIEAPDTTLVLPPGRKCVIDEYLNCVIEST